MQEEMNLHDEELRRLRYNLHCENMIHWHMQQILAANDASNNSESIDESLISDFISRSKSGNQLLRHATLLSGGGARDTTTSEMQQQQQSRKAAAAQVPTRGPSVTQSDVLLEDSEVIEQ